MKYRHMAWASAGLLGLGGFAWSTHDVRSADTFPVGRELASNCFQCHGTNGRGPGFDDLSGKSSNSIYSDLKEFASGQEGDGIMAVHAKGYTDQQLRELSDYIASVN